MPLDRAHITKASRVMLPTYPILFAWFGLVLLMTRPAVMEATPSFKAAANIMPLRTWGAILVGVALFQGFSLMSHRRSVYLASLGVGLIAMLAWTLVFSYAALHGGAPWSAAQWPAFVGVCCIATMRSLESRET